MQIRTVIVDDEQPARDELRYLLSKHPDIHITGEADSASKAVELIVSTKPDLVFLDIQMPGKNGFDVLKALVGKAEPLVVFATAFDDYAVKAFEESAVDYILKPLSEKRLGATLERIRKRLMAETAEESSQNPLLEQALRTLLTQIQPVSKQVRISVEKNGRMRLLDPADIIFCSYETSGILIHTFDSTFSLYGIPTMDRLAEHLVGSSFFRAHRSLLINLDKIREFSPWFHGKYHLIMDDSEKSELAISRNRVKDFKERLGL